MVIKQVLACGVEILRQSNIQNPLFEAQLILSKHLKIDRLHIMTNPQQKVDSQVISAYLEDINKRLNGMPTQYITGIQEFMSLPFKVDASVLIPRPETEILVEEVIKRIDNSKYYNILDIGTGSGCIAISIAKYIEDCTVYSVDISDDALKIAQYNAEINNVEHKVNFLKGNVFEPFNEEKELFDIIVSNPPYISTHIIQSLDICVKDYEPLIALDGGIDGLKFYRQIISESGGFMKLGGIIFFEIGYDQSSFVTKLLQEYNFDDITIIKDLAGLDRVTYAKFK